MNEISKGDQILRERARRLANRGQEDAAAQTLCRVVEVQVGDSRYALPLDQILEVRPLKELTPVPGAPPECLGLVNVRNELRAVVDLAALLGGAVGSPSAATGGFLIFPRPAICGERQVGLRVSAVGNVYDLNRATLSAAVGAEGSANAARRGVSEAGISLLDLSFLFRSAKGVSR
ncbi:MAG: chemotaxis protein CheW [Proteobacteria bacterium]|nr:MAG: chemotaxis protein CheW [Pseudomonadota bacterium]